MARDQDSTVTLINFSWATYHTTPLKMICAKYSNVMVELLSYACTVNRMTDVNRKEIIPLEYLITDLSRLRINRL